MNRSAPRSIDQYLQQLREQLAGDAFGVDEATGFIVGGAFDRVTSPDPVLTAQQRADELHDMVSTTGVAFLAVTLGLYMGKRDAGEGLLLLDFFWRSSLQWAQGHWSRRYAKS